MRSARHRVAIEATIPDPRSQAHPARLPRRVRHATSFAAASLLALTLAAPVFARPLVSGNFSGTDSGTECGTYVRASTFSGWFMIKDATPATNGQFFYFENRVEYADVITNPETGAFFTVTGNSLFKESQARLVEGNVFTYNTIEAGQPFVVTDMTGNVVLRDVGLIEVSYVFDSLGDGAPGGIQLENPTLVRVAGTHPGFEDTFDFCVLADQLIG